MQDFTHFNDQGRAKMVDVGDKPATVRTAVAAGRVTVNENTFALIKNGIDISLTLDEARHSVEITASASCAGHTGVEMEALTAVSAAALTVYDMCKAVQKDILISDIHLLEKTGGVHGDYSYAGK